MKNRNTFEKDSLEELKKSAVQQMPHEGIKGFSVYFKPLYRRDWQVGLVEPSKADDMPEIWTGGYMSYSGDYAGSYLIEQRLNQWRIICYKDSWTYSGTLNDCFNMFIQKNNLNMIVMNGKFTGNFNEGATDDNHRFKFTEK